MADASHSPASSNPTITGDVDANADGFVRSAASALVGDLTEKLGSFIGRYKLLQLLGEGGFGVVYMAEQEKPVKRRVAVKVIKAGMDSRAVIARFEAERQALAMMDHPNIAHVLDAGATDSGRPYFVMELVKGIPITEYCDQSNLDTDQRLKLFIDVCHAVQHAHQKGIIHRDLKPSNIMVTIHDDAAVVKVIDFGIAKATDQKLTEMTLFTNVGQMIGTPVYMSPEQAVMTGLDVDTRSDIYSLGVLLYEMLAGSPPFDAQTLRKAGFDEMRRIIREQSPQKPSTRLSTLAQDAKLAVANHRQVSPAVLSRQLNGDLDWIVLKALEKDRTRRYESASAFAQDIERHLQSEPVLAGAPGTAYKLRKFAQRNRGPVIAIALLALALVGGLVGTSYGLRQAVKARDGEAWARLAAQHEAERAREEANRAVKAELQTKARAEELSKVADFQSRMLAQIDPSATGLKMTENVRAGFDAALAKAGVSDRQRPAQAEAFATLWSRLNATDLSRDLIDDTILKPAVTAIDAQFPDQPVVAATLRSALAERYHELGSDAAALSLEQRTLEQRRRVLGDDNPDTLVSMSNLAGYLEAVGRTAEAEAYDREVLQRSRRVRGNDDPVTLMCVSDVGDILRNQNKLNEAEPFLREALDSRRRVLGPLHPDTLRSMVDWAGLLRSQGKPTEAEACDRDALAKCRSALGEDSEVTLHTMNELAVLLQNQGKYDEGIALLRELVEKRRRTYGDVHPKTLSELQSLGSFLDLSGHGDEAEAMLRDTLTKEQRLLGPDNSSTLVTEGNLSALLINLNRLTEAEPLCRDTLERRRRVLGDSHPETLVAINIMGLVLRRENKLTEAEPFIREMVTTARRVLGPAHPDTLIYVHNLAAFLNEQDKVDEAEPLFRDVVQTGGPAIGFGHPTVLSATRYLGSILLNQKKNAEAFELLKAAEPFARNIYTGNGERQLARFLILLGRSQNRVGQHATAETNLLQAHEINLRVLGPKDVGTRYSASVLSAFYTDWEKAEPGKGYAAKAAAWQTTVKQLQAATQPAATNPSK